MKHSYTFQINYTNFSTFCKMDDTSTISFYSASITNGVALTTFLPISIAKLVDMSFFSPILSFHSFFWTEVLQGYNAMTVRFFKMTHLYHIMSIFYLMTLVPQILFHNNFRPEQNLKDFKLSIQFYLFLLKQSMCFSICCLHLRTVYLITLKSNLNISR